MAKREFRFSIEITITAVLAAALCYSMSYWQASRYEQKQAYEAAVARAEGLSLDELEPGLSSWDQFLYATAEIRGRFDHARSMYLINRSKDNTAGVKVVTPVTLEGMERRLLVDRGFLPFEAYRAEDKSSWQPTEEIDLVGMLRPSQTRNFFLSPEQTVNADGSFRDRWFRLEVEVMEKQLPYPVFPVYLEQTNQGQAGFPVHDPREVLSSGVHLNYTIQWASFGTFALVFAWFLQYRPKRVVRTEPIDEAEKRSER